MSEHSNDNNNKWTCPGVYDKCPREEVQFIIQSLILIIIVVVALYNLTLHYENNTQLWSSILSCCFGILVPSPGVPRSNSKK